MQGSVTHPIDTLYSDFLFWLSPLHCSGALLPVTALLCLLVSASSHLALYLESAVQKMTVIRPKMIIESIAMIAMNSLRWFTLSSSWKIRV